MDVKISLLDGPVKPKSIENAVCLAMQEKSRTRRQKPQSNE
jgi:hypothetical protein